MIAFFYYIVQSLLSFYTYIYSAISCNHFYTLTCCCVLPTELSHPKELFVTQDDEYKVILSWKPPNGSLNGYTIEYRNTGHEEFQQLPINNTGIKFKFCFIASAANKYEFRVVEIRSSGDPATNYSKLPS